MSGLVYHKDGPVPFPRQLDKDELVAEIIRIIAQPGEDATDGECLDEVLSLLESQGYRTPWTR